MDKIWVLLIALLIFVGFAFLIWKLTSGEIKTEYGTKMWKHWPSKLYYWQGVVLYGVGLTLITILLLKWLNVLTF
jgi:hypothetical protein